MNAPPGPRYRLVLDLQATQSLEHADRGVARYAIEETRALLRSDDLVASIVLNPSLPFPRHLPPDLLASPLLQWNTASDLRRTAAESDRPLAYYVLSPFEFSVTAEADVPPHCVRGEIPIIVTLYDLIPLLMAERYLAAPSAARRYHSRLELLHQADLVVTISEHTRRDAVEHLGLDPARIRTIGAGVSTFFHRPAPGSEPGRLLAERLPAIDRPFVLTVSGGDARKNAEGLLSAWARVSPEVRSGRQLVVACKLDDDLRRAWAGHGEGEGLSADDVVFTGWIHDEVLRALYQAAELFVFPSLYEGFGLPAAEAIACGCPALVSNTSSLPEVLDWEPATFDPHDPGDMAALVERALTDDDFAAALRARADARVPELTWEAVADRVVGAIDDVLPDPSPGPTRLRPRIALMGPLPPTLSGIADYNARLLPRLAARAHVDLVSNQRPPPELHHRIPDARVFPPSALGRNVNPWAYDAIVYTLGNSSDHHDSYEAALRWPGLVWLHDVRLAGLYLTYARERVPADEADEWLAEKLEQMYGTRVPALMEPKAADPPPEWAEAGLGMTRELVGSARGVVVSSALAQRLLEIDQGPDGVLPRSWVLPLGASSVEEVPLPPPAGGDAPLIVSFGIVAPIKGTDLLIAALAHLRERVAAELAFVGPVDDEYQAHLEKVAAAHGVAEAVRFTGQVPDEAYRAWLRRGRCAVQLRTATYGESSAAVLDCLAAGLPVVTSVVAARELPPGTVEWVPVDVSPGALADRLEAILTDPVAHSRLREGGFAYAREWDLDAVADELIAIIDEL